MNQLTSKNSNEMMNNRTDRLKRLIHKNSDGIGLLDDAKLMNSISYELAVMRKEKKLTQKQLAALLGVKQSNISRWERAGYQGYKVSMLSRVARILGGQLYISLRPNINVQINLDRFHYTKDTHRIVTYTDGTFQQEHNTTTIHYEGARVYARS